MPKGPQGQKRPADAIGCAVMVGRIATGEEEDKMPGKKRASGLAGAKGRMSNTTKEQRRNIAKQAAQARWEQ